MENNKCYKKNYYKNMIMILVVIFIIVSIFTVLDAKKQTNIEINKISINESIDNELKEALYKIKNIKNSKSLAIAFITDVHMNNDEENLYMNNINAFTDICNSGLIDVSINGGDLYYGDWKNRNEGITNLRYAKLLYSNIKVPILYARGNHDCNIKTLPDEAISNEDYYNIILKSLEGTVKFNEKDEYGGYYYKDFENQKIRVCVLNAFCGENYQYIFGDEQLQFIAEDMLNLENKKNPEEWKIIFFSHTIEASDAHEDSVEDKEKFYEILESYKNASKVQINNKEIDYSKQGKGTVIAIITGHHHLDSVKYESSYPIITTRAASALYDRDEKEDGIEGTKDELVFDVFVIDGKKNEIKAIRIGRGEDRTFNF